jgi:hypothetical protein
LARKPIKPPDFTMLPPDYSNPDGQKVLTRQLAMLGKVSVASLILFGVCAVVLVVGVIVALIVKLA